MKKRFFVGVFLVVGWVMGLYSVPLSHAHTPLLSCYDNADGTVTCEGGFSDGSSASGMEMRVENTQGQVLVRGVMGENSEYTFDKPATPFTVVFDAGDDHLVEVNGKDISE